ncbi:nuclear transport factor 2 family protein [Kribbella sp. NPDC055071]
MKPNLLPEAITTYLAGHTARDIDAAMRWYAEDAVVTDDGKTYRGRDEIRAWLGNAATEYTYTSELTGARQSDETTYVATHHLEGNFPGGSVDLDFTFTLKDDLIVHLVIA